MGSTAMRTLAFWQSMNSFRRPGVMVINTANIPCYIHVSFRTFKILKYILSQLSLLNQVSWPTPCWFEHCPHFEVSESSQCQCFHFLQNADCAHGLPKTWCGRLHPDCWWKYLKPVVWCAPCMVCGSTMQATRFRRPQVLIAAHKSLSNLRKHYQW